MFSQAQVSLLQVAIARSSSRCVRLHACVCRVLDVSGPCLQPRLLLIGSINDWALKVPRNELCCIKHSVFSPMHSSCRSSSSFDSFKGPGIDKGHAPLHSMLCNFELELLHDQVGLAQWEWMRYSEPLGSDAGLQRLTASPSCSLVESKPSLTRGRRFGSTALPLLVGATGSLLGGACHRQQLIVGWE